MRPPPRDVPGHAARVDAEIAEAVRETQARQPVQGIDPALILKVQMSRQLAEEDWRAAGFQVLAQEADNILVLFSSDFELTQFRQRLAQYRGEIPDGQKHPVHNGLFANIERIAALGPDDRIGPRMKAEGIQNAAAVDARRRFTVDVEIWDAATDAERQVRVQNLANFIEEEGGEVLSRYVGKAGLLLLRAKIRGALFRRLLNVTVVAQIDLPPSPDLGEQNPPDLRIDDMDDPVPPPANAPIIGIIDSGLSDHPLLAGTIVGRFGIPAALGDADLWGHGTRVTSIAAFGDVRECVDRRSFASPVRIVSAKVVNDQGRFDDAATVPEQMELAIRELRRRGCRVINISLGDQAKIPYDGGRLSPWASTLDMIAAELDVLIIVSAGNPKSGAGAPWGDVAEGITREYPRYLVLPSNRLIDPATAACAITVGSLAHGNGLRNDDGDGAEVRALTQRDDPSPRTRAGPGTANAIKPDL
ncbi:MAG: S8 family peptidase, partial [Proteobacteria bacterium]|nr:S8 family peptidase [Pseudomonadota bacterium]